MWRPGSGSRARPCMTGWPSTRLAVWRIWVIGRIGPGRVRTRSVPMSRSRSRGCAQRIRGGVRGGSPSSWPRSAGGRLAKVELAKVELAKVELAGGGGAAPSESAVYRALLRLGLIDPGGRRRRDRKWKRWERGEPMELWQMDVVGGFVLADGRRAKALTGVDDHSRFCISAHLMHRETSQRVCEGLALALRTWGVPGQILTDNGEGLHRAGSTSRRSRCCSTGSAGRTASSTC